MNRSLVVRVVAASSLVTVAGLATAGPPNPPAGPVAPTYKTLTEVEPRTAINAANTPGDANSLFRITQPGSYYLTGNIAGAAGKNGIYIVASGAVTIDLNGFEIVGVPLSKYGILTEFGWGTQVRVRNGAVRGFGNDGINVSGEGSVVESVRAIANAGSGISVGNTGVVRGCVSTDNVVYGIDTGDSAIVDGCTVRDNINNGIRTMQGGTVSGCTAFNNGAAGILLGVSSVISRCTARFNDGRGIEAGQECIVESCTASQNQNEGIETGSRAQVRQCLAYGNGTSGIVVSSLSTVTGNTLEANTVDGIRVTNDCSVVGNSCYGNGAGAGDGAGIHATSLSNRIEGNSCNDNDRGIDIDAAGNFISRNTCSGNGLNWSVVAGNVCLVVNGVPGAAISGNSGGSAPGSTDPNANFTH